MNIKRKMRIVKKILILLLLPLLLHVCYSEQNSDSPAYEAIIKRIEVNNEPSDYSPTKEILVASKDILSFKYGVKGEKQLKTRLYYTITITPKDPALLQSIETTDTIVRSYTNLPETDYDIVITPLDKTNFRNKKTKSAVIKLRVNDREAKLKKEVDKWKKKAIEGKKSFREHEYLASILIGLAVGALITAMLMMFFRHRKKSLVKSSITISKPGKMENNNDMVQLSKEEYDRIITEKNNLQSEIKALRGQIDALQVRSGELYSQNRELEQRTNTLDLSKNELLDLQKQKDDLFAVIIHDIKNPVALIKGLVELLRSYDLTASEQQKIIDDIVATTAKIVKLSQEVSKIMALEGSKLILNFEKVDINEILRDVHRRNMVGADKKNIAMTLNVKDDLPSVEIDINKIDEVIDNLISNAIKFSNPGGKIRISSELKDDKVVVSVSDNGLGLSEEDIKKAFRKGGKLSARPTGDESSTGLGLWIVKKLVEGHHGNVWVKSSLGRGSTFYFSVPLSQVGYSNEEIKK